MQLSVREVARLLKVSENTVYGWVDERSLPAQQINSQYFFNKAELLEWAALQKVDVAPEIFALGPAGNGVDGNRDLVRHRAADPEVVLASRSHAGAEDRSRWSAT